MKSPADLKSQAAIHLGYQLQTVDVLERIAVVITTTLATSDIQFDEPTPMIHRSARELYIGLCNLQRSLKQQIEECEQGEKA